MTRSFIVAEREFARLAKGRGGKAMLAGVAAIVLVELVARRGFRAASSIGAGRPSLDLSRLDLMLSSLIACLVAALAFSAEELGGTAALLRSIGLRRGEYVGGKYLGAAIWSALAAATATILAAVVVDPASGSLAVLLPAAFAAGAVYAAWGACFGIAGKSALSAALSALAFWVATVFAYEGLLWAILPALPYMVAKPALAVFLAIDPAEALRLGMVFLSGAGAVFGPEFYYWQRFLAGGAGIACALGLLLAHVALPAALAASFSKRNS